MSDAPKRGPKPAAVKGALSEHELTGLFAEAFEAYDMVDERVRFDSRQRRWVFVVVKRNQVNELMLKLSRGPNAKEDYIATSLLSSDIGRPLIQETVRTLDGAVA